VDTYVLSAVDDHIVPWTAAYRTTQLLGGRSRFVLSTSGHIAGIVNPPSPKAKHWVGEEPLPSDPSQWKESATLVEDTWWEDWATWAAEQGGAMVKAPRRLGSTAYPPLEEAPGRYVRDRT
jgi:polyhydroxyalkanoate synthase